MFQLIWPTGSLVFVARRAPNAGGVEYSLEMREWMDSRTSYDGIKLRVRIGVNSGSAVGAVVGTTKFAYDLWGDTINVASRMESSGEPGRIQVAEGAFSRLRDKYVLEPRGKIEIKGKGEMETWFLKAPI